MLARCTLELLHQLNIHEVILELDQLWAPVLRTMFSPVRDQPPPTSARRFGLCCSVLLLAIHCAQPCAAASRDGSRERPARPLLERRELTIPARAPRSPPALTSAAWGAALGPSSSSAALAAARGSSAERCSA